MEIEITVVKSATGLVFLVGYSHALNASERDRLNAAMERLVYNTSDRYVILPCLAVTGYGCGEAVLPEEAKRTMRELLAQSDCEETSRPISQQES